MPSTQFLNLPEEKQQRIVCASLGEFAAHGYDMASTNRIVQRAGISKGVLFKYFVDKEALFLYVCGVCTQSYIETIPRETADDLFEFIRRTTMHKMRFMRERPLTYRLLVRVAKEPRHPVYAKVMNSQIELLHQFVDDLKAALPSPEKLRPGLTWQNVLDFTTWIGLGLQEKFISTIPDVVDESFEESYQPMIDELNVFLDILKYGIYKEARQP